MSTRYVWEKYSLNAAETQVASGSGYNNEQVMNLDNSFWSWKVDSWGEDYTLSGGPVYFNIGSSYAISNGKLVIQGSSLVTVPNGVVLSSSGYNPFQLDRATGSSHTWYFGVGKNGNNSYDTIYKVYIRDTNFGLGASLDLDFYFREEDGHKDIALSIGPATYFDYTGSKITLSQGSAAGYATNSASGAYPARITPRLRRSGGAESARLMRPQYPQKYPLMSNLR